MVVMLGGEEMNKLFEHVGGMIDEDTYIEAMDKVEQGIMLLTNQVTARFKLFQEMPQDGRGFREWSQLVVEQADRCDWSQYDKSKAARDAILFQMEDKIADSSAVGTGASTRQVSSSRRRQEDALMHNLYKAHAWGGQV